jgi:hypothetical protein
VAYAFVQVPAETCTREMDSHAEARGATAIAATPVCCMLLIIRVLPFTVGPLTVAMSPLLPHKETRVWVPNASDLNSLIISAQLTRDF